MTKGLGKLRLLGAAATIAGAPLVTARPAQAAATSSSCAFCEDNCPGSLDTYCYSNGCGASGAACKLLDCQATDDSWHKYEVDCAAPN